MPISDVTFVPDPSAEALAVMSVVEAVVVQTATPLAELADAEVGYLAIQVLATPGEIAGELAPVSLRVQRTATLAVV